jgi:hypothetical protein
MDLAGTSRTRPPTQYADTCPSSQSTTASGPFSKRGSTAADAVVFFATAFFAPGRRDDAAAGLAVLLAAGRDGGTATGAGAGSGARPVNASGTTGAGAAGASVAGAGKRAARPSSSRAYAARFGGRGSVLPVSQLPTASRRASSAVAICA